MAKIKPFAGVIYNQKKVKDISRLVCPPYDIISPERQNYYHERDPYNFIQILLGKDLSQEDKYRRASRLFREWLRQEVFVKDETPCIYFYRQRFIVRGEKKDRLGFIALLHLENSKKPSIFGHEHTRLEPKEDRLRLLRNVKANLSPIFAVCPDTKRIIPRFFTQYASKEKPFIDLVDDEKTRHQLWRISSAEVLSKIVTAMKDENIFIADGHHRFEVACAFRQEMKKKYKHSSGEEGFNYIMAYFTNTDPQGLVILPVHRLLRLGAKQDIDSIRLKLAAYFNLEEVRDKQKFFFLMEKYGLTEHVIGMYKERRFWILRLKNVRILDTLIQDKPKEFRSLDVAILNYLVLKDTFGLPAEDNSRITYSNNADEFIEKADADNSYIAFFLNPCRIQQVISVALSGHKMPPKSTYFYPKVLSGLVINALE